MTTTSTRPTAGAAPGRAAGGDWRARLRGSRLGTLAVLLVTTLLVLGGAALVNRPAEQAGNGVQAVDVTGQLGPAPVVGQPAHPFTAMTTDGTPVSLASLRGQPVWLTFGASWCASCRVEAPDIQAAHEQGRTAGVQVVAVYLSEDATAVKGFAQRVGLTYTHVPDLNTQIAAAYRVMGIPTHYFIDRDGVLRAVDVGVLTPDTMRARLASISR